MDTEVFEIREYLDEEGNEVKSEVLSMKQALQEIEQSDFADKLHEFANRASKQGDGQQPQQKQQPQPPPSASPSSLDAMLDQHDWDGINARAAEIEAENAKTARLKEKERAKLQGSGWKKGFLGGGGGGGSKKGGAVTGSSAAAGRAKDATGEAGPPSPADTTSTTSTTGRGGAAAAASKQVRFQLPETKEPESAKETQEFESRLQQNGFGMPSVAAAPRPPIGAAASDKTGEQSRPTAFTGAVSERTGGISSSGPQIGGLEAGGQQPTMSKFKARRLGLLRDHDDDAN